MKKFLFFALFAVALYALWHQYNAGPPAPEKKVLLDVWVCPAHRDMEYDKPGKCKLCGQDLVQKEAPKL